MPKATTSKTTSTPSARKTSSRSTRGRNSKSSDATIRLDSDTRQRMIAEAAYYRAEIRGFMPGSEDADWFAAEHEINNQYP